MVSEGAWWTMSPRFESVLTGPYPHTVVAGRLGGRICWVNCLIEIS